MIPPPGEKIPCGAPRAPRGAHRGCRGPRRGKGHGVVPPRTYTPPPFGCAVQEGLGLCLSLFLDVCVVSDDMGGGVHVCVGGGPSRHRHLLGGTSTTGRTEGVPKIASHHQHTCTHGKHQRTVRFMMSFFAPRRGWRNCVTVCDTCVSVYLRIPKSRVAGPLPLCIGFKRRFPRLPPPRLRIAIDSGDGIGIPQRPSLSDAHGPPGWVRGASDRFYNPATPRFELPGFCDGGQ